MIAEEIHRITEQLPSGVRLVAVSKYHPASAIREAYAAGQRLFGESHAQELQGKHVELSDLAGLEWHFIGHLQTNKVKYIAPYVSLIHAADSPRLLEEINKQALKAGRVVRCLLQLHVAEEETKFGFTTDEAQAYLDSGAWQQLEGVELAGVMAMATNTDDTTRIRADFHRRWRLADDILRSKEVFRRTSSIQRRLSKGNLKNLPVRHGPTPSLELPPLAAQSCADSVQ